MIYLINKTYLESIVNLTSLLLTFLIKYNLEPQEYGILSF